MMDTKTIPSWLSLKFFYLQWEIVRHGLIGGLIEQPRLPESGRHKAGVEEEVQNTGMLTFKLEWQEMEQGEWVQYVSWKNIQQNMSMNYSQNMKEKEEKEFELSGWGSHR